MADGRGRGVGGGPAGGIAVAAVGDVVLAREDPAAAFARVAPLLRGADLRVANCEVPLSNRGLPQHAKHEVLHSSPEMIAGFVAAGFDVVSLANNHTMDYGPEALLETIERLGRHGIACCGAGADDAAAWRPAVVERRGLRVGEEVFVAFSPERLYSGAVFRNLAAYPKLVGGIGQASTDRAALIVGAFDLQPEFRWRVDVNVGRIQRDVAQTIRFHRNDRIFDRLPHVACMMKNTP